MAYIPKQIGWSQGSSLLQQVAKQIDQLTKVTAAGIVFTTTTSTTSAP